LGSRAFIKYIGIFEVLYIWHQDVYWRLWLIPQSFGYRYQFISIYSNYPKNVLFSNLKLWQKKKKNGGGIFWLYLQIFTNVQNLPLLSIGWPEFRRQNFQSIKYSMDFPPIDLDLNRFGLSIVSTKPTLT
jgi:hypothetical protein